MQQILDWLQQNPSVQIAGFIFGVLGWVVGIISGSLQVRGYIEQRRFQGAYKELLEHAKATWQGRYTQQQVDELSRELDRLGTQIQKQIPLQAKQVFLQEKAAALAENIAQSYEQYQLALIELQRYSESIDLPRGVKSAIEYDIMPKYLQRESLEREIRRQLALSALILITLLMVWFALPPLASVLLPLGLLFVFGPLGLVLFREYVWSDIQGYMRSIFRTK